MYIEYMHILKGKNILYSRYANKKYVFKLLDKIFT